MEVIYRNDFDGCACYSAYAEDGFDAGPLLYRKSAEDPDLHYLYQNPLWAEEKPQIILFSDFLNWYEPVDYKKTLDWLFFQKEIGIGKNLGFPQAGVWFQVTGAKIKKTFLTRMDEMTFCHDVIVIADLLAHYENRTFPVEEWYRFRTFRSVQNDLMGELKVSVYRPSENMKGWPMLDSLAPDFGFGYASLEKGAAELLWTYYDKALRRPCRVNAYELADNMGYTVEKAFLSENSRFRARVVFDESKVLVIAPLRVARDTWPDEVQKWDHLKELEISVITGTVKQRTAAVNHNAFIYIVNRENVKWLVEYYEKNGLRWDYDMIVIDELSSFKNYQSQRFKWLRKVRPFVKRWVGLTGTPTSNGLMDLWAEIGILDGGERLGRFIGRFRESYFKPSSMNPSTGVVFAYTPRPGAEQQIYEKISDITISMKALDYLDMPECVFVNHEVEMDAAERKLYDQLKHDLIIPLEDGDIDAANAASLSNKLLQMANGAVYDENKEVRRIHNHKLEMLEDLIEAANGQPVLVGYWFKHDRTRIIEHLTACGYKPRDIKSSDDIADWNSGSIPVALIHPASAGHGLNIQSGGHILIWFGLTWSLELYQQTNARLWRQGQTSTVTIHHIVTKNTVDSGQRSGRHGGRSPIPMASPKQKSRYASGLLIRIRIVPSTSSGGMVSI